MILAGIIWCFVSLQWITWTESVWPDSEGGAVGETPLDSLTGRMPTAGGSTRWTNVLTLNMHCTQYVVHTCWEVSLDEIPSITIFGTCWENLWMRFQALPFRCWHSFSVLLNYVCFPRAVLCPWCWLIGTETSVVSVAYSVTVGSLQSHYNVTIGQCHRTIQCHHRNVQGHYSVTHCRVSPESWRATSGSNRVTTQAGSASLQEANMVQDRFTTEWPAERLSKVTLFLDSLGPLARCQMSEVNKTSAYPFGFWGVFQSCPPNAPRVCVQKIS